MGERRRVCAAWAAAGALVALAGCTGPSVVPVASSPIPTHAASPALEAASHGAVAARSVAVGRDGARVAGVDVSRYQPVVDWAGLVATGHRFVYVKATEGTGHVSPTHDEQRTAARAAGLFQGAYHYARPGQSSGTLQARFFQGHGGTWGPDGVTLPGVLDLEFAEEGDRCHGLTPDQMVGWVREFSDEYVRLSGRLPVIYTRAEVWDACTAADTSFGDHPLWLFDHGPQPGALPAGWDHPTLWQRGVEEHLDRNIFFGDDEQLRAWVSAPVG